MMLRNVMLRRRINPKTGTHTLCKPAQSKCTWTFHKTHLIRKFTGKMPGPRVNQERGHTFCASVRSRNSLGHLTRATLDGNLQEKCRNPNRAP